jgi:hypothetical protein
MRRPALYLLTQDGRTFEKAQHVGIEVVFSCDVGDEKSNAVINLTGSTQINRGAPVRISSFRLAMP